MNTRKKKHIFRSIISVLFILLFASQMAFAEDANTSGTCGDNLTWILDNGILTISGSGEMSEGASSSWFALRDDISSIVVSEGVTSISDEAFKDLYCVTYVEIADTVTSIGNSAFSGCYNLLDVEMQEGVVSIGNFAFYYCIKLESITIPSSVTTVGNLVFYWCENLKTAGPIDGGYNIEYGWTEAIPAYAFNGCDSLTDILLPDGITSIGTEAFSDCSALTDIVIPESVTALGSYAFNGCSSLENITLLGDISSIGAYTFSGCSSLLSIEIPSGVTSIGTYAFSGCSSLEMITIPSGVTSIGQYAFRGCTQLTTAGAIGGGYTIEFGWNEMIPARAFYGCSSLESIAIPDSVTAIGAYAFYGCSSMTSIVLSESVTSVDSYVFYGCSKLTSITVPGTLTFIGSYAFSNCKGLTTAGPLGGEYNIEFGWTEEIPEYAFYKCESLTEITLPSGMLSIGEYSFYGCKSLKSIEIPEGVTSIGGYAFYDCSSLSSVTIPDSVTSVGKTVFYNCVCLTTAGPVGGGYDIEFGWEINIPAYAFNGCKSLTEIIIPSGVEEINEHAFDGCESLENVVLPGSITSIGAYAFYGCSSLADISLPEGVDSIGGYAFASCKSLTSLIIPDGVSVIEGFMFQGCSSLISIVLSENITSIGDCAFYGCSSLESISIPSGISKINFYTFYSCSSLLNVVIPEGVTAIDGGAFNNCSGLVSITIPVSVTSIKSIAFSNCNSLTDVYYWGAESDWELIDVGYYNSSLTSATIHYNYDGDTSQDGDLLITSQPMDYTGEAGSIATFTIEATGTDLTYQWEYSDNEGETWNTSTASSAKASTYTSTLTTARDGRMVRCIVTDANGNTVTSDAATMLIEIAEVILAITTQPTDYTGAEGSTASFTVEAEGTDLTYQWEYSDDEGETWNTSTASSAKKSTYISTLTAARDGRMVRCIVTDANGNTLTSDTAMMSIEPVEVSLAITAQPKNYTGEEGSTASFTVEAEGTDLTYQWEYSDDEGKTWNISTASSAKKPTYSSTLTAARDGRMVRCIVSDASENIVTSDTATMAIETTQVVLAITTQPTDYTGAEGSTATFTIVAEGNGLTYQWQYSDDNGETWNISTASSANEATYTSKLTTVRDGRMVRCIVTDADGNRVTSDTAMMKIM